MPISRDELAWLLKSRGRQLPHDIDPKPIADLMFGSHREPLSDTEATRAIRAVAAPNVSCTA